MSRERNAGCCPERARAIVQLLLDQDPAGELVAFLGNPKARLQPKRTGRGFALTEEVRSFILGPECAELTHERIAEVCTKRFGTPIARSTVALCLHKAGKSKRAPHKMKTAVKKFVAESMGLTPEEVCAAVKERWGTDISTGSVYKVWKEKSKPTC